MRVTPVRLAAVAAAVAVAALAGWTVHVLSQSNIRRSGTNHVDLPHFVAGASRHQAICQRETVPEDTGAAMMLITDYHEQPTPAIELSVRTAGGRVLASGGLPQGWIEGDRYIRLSPPVPRTTEAQLCLADRGRNPITVAGENVEPAAGATVAGQRVNGRMSVMWYRPGNETWLDVASVVLARIRHGKASWFGPWLPVAFVLLIAACLAGAVYLAVRPCES
jgi:hypothetical protein